MNKILQISISLFSAALLLAVVSMVLKFTIINKKLDEIRLIPVVNIEGVKTGEIPLHEAISRIHNLEQANTDGLIEVLNKIEKLTTASSTK